MLQFVFSVVHFLPVEVNFLSIHVVIPHLSVLVNVCFDVRYILVILLIEGVWVSILIKIVLG